MVEKGKNIDELVRKCLFFTDRNGRVLSKDSTPISSSLSMEYKNEKEKMYILFKIFQHAYGNGSLSIIVKQNNETMLEATGGFIGGGTNIEAKKYLKGDWEKKIDKNTTPEEFYKIAKEKAKKIFGIY